MRRRGDTLVLVAVLSLPVAAQAWRQALEDARVLQQKGALREASKAYQALLPELRRDSPPDLASALNALSQIDSARGDYESAMARARESGDLYRSLGDRTGETRAVNSLGVAEGYRGDYGAAMGHFRAALALARSNGDLEGEVEELNNLGTLDFLQARYLDALREFREASERVEKGGDAPWVARRRRVTLLNLAALYQQALGQEQKALQLYQELRDAPGALPPSEQARLLTNQGVLYRRLNDPLKALQTYEAAERLFETEEHNDGTISVLKNIGIVRALDLRDLPSALDAFNRALALAQRAGNRRETMQAHLYRGETLVRQGAVDEAERDFTAALALARELSATEDQWKALYGLGRVARARGDRAQAAREFQEAIERIESVRAKLQLPSLKTDFLADKRDVYDALIELMLEKPDPRSLFELLERSRARNFQERVARSPPTLASVQARLEAGTVLLEFSVGPRSAAVLWVTREEAGVVPLMELRAELPAISSFVSAVSADSGDGWRAAAESIGERLLAGVPPLQHPSARHLIIVPDGPLGELPFELVSIGGALVVERFDVSYLPSAVILQREPPSWNASWAFPWKRQLIAFGDPRIVRGGKQSAFEELGGPELLGDLPASAEEVLAIAAICPGRSELHLGKDDVKAPLLKGRAGGVPLLHLGTHATADADNPEQSRILFSPAHEEDGADYLFLKETYDLDLRGVDLATLSACDTERGKSIRGEGLQGFSRALIAAGSRAAVTTLWRVADEPTRELMKQFYFALNQGASKAEALRLAKLSFLRSRTPLRHPRFWAAFILGGDGLRPIPRVVPWSWLTGAAGVVVLAAMIALRRRVRRRVDGPSSGS